MTYWHYTYIKPGPGKGFTIGYGIHCIPSELDTFNFAGYYRQYPDCFILNLNRIDQTQYDALMTLIEEAKQKEDGK